MVRTEQTLACEAPAEAGGVYRTVAENIPARTASGVTIDDGGDTIGRTKTHHRGRAMRALATFTPAIDDPAGRLQGD